MKKRAIAALALTAALFFAGCAGNTEGTEGGTYFVQFDMQRQNVFIDGEQIGASEFTSLSGKMRDRIAALEEEFSTDLAGSDLSRVNAAAAGETVSVSGDTMEAFTLAESYASLTGGSFSPALFPLTDLPKAEVRRIAIRAAFTAFTALMALRSMHGICTCPATGSQVSPRLCSIAISAALHTCAGLPPSSSVNPAAAIEQATPISP